MTDVRTRKPKITDLPRVELSTHVTRATIDQLRRDFADERAQAAGGESFRQADRLLERLVSLMRQPRRTQPAGV